MKRVTRAAARVTVGLGIAGATVTMAAAPALATSGTLTVSPNGTVTSNGVISISARYSNTSATSSASLKLTIDRPDQSTYTLWTGSARPLSSGTTTQSFNTASTPWSSTEAVNGTYTVNFSVGSASATSVDVTLRVPPATVTGFGASTTGTVAHFGWSANSEPDLAGYDIVDVSGGSRRDLTPSGIDPSACNAGSCAVDIDFGSSAAGSTHQFVIDALRWTSPTESATVASPDSAPASVTFPVPSTPAAGGGSAGSGGTTGGTSGSTTGGTTGSTTSGGHVAAGKTGKGAISSSHASAALRAYLPVTTAGAAPDLPSVVTEVKPLPQGSYNPTLAYPDQVVHQPVTHKAAASPSVGTDIANVLDVAALWKSLGAAAVMLLLAGHLRAWLNSAAQTFD